MAANTTSRILGEAKRNVRPPADSERTNTWPALHYATNVIKGRFPEGVDAIAENPIASHNYATEVIKGRFPEGEDAIATSPAHAWYAVNYALNVIKGRWPEAEKAIARSLKDALEDDRDAAIEVVYAYLKAFPEAKLEWIMNGWLDWLDT